VEVGAPSGEFGFFQAPGTNYSVGNEPEIASRLNTMGKALHLHLIGISGYRTPQHSLEVGGFADDPHTRGEASDTPGVEGVPESILEKFGLTRPFPGAAEADHIQLLGSAR
ncbi:MAG: D-Ala-D-Ala carboxypeptidase family metallohydrolase, partial [Solirubrobacteraceae bacterium]